jgi:hypothetical protein
VRGQYAAPYVKAHEQTDSAVLERNHLMAITALHDM